MFNAMYKEIHQLISNGKFKILNSIWIHLPIQGMLKQQCVQILEFAQMLQTFIDCRDYNKNKYTYENFGIFRTIISLSVAL